MPVFIRAISALIFFFISHSAMSASPVPSAPDVAARGFIIQDFESGRILAEKNADERLEPASLTKIMTAYITFRELAAGNISFDEDVIVSEKAWRTPGSRMFIEVNNKVSVRDLVTGMIVQSGNDASVALAEHIAGSEETFAELMNTNAIRLGMAHSHFMNATGLPNAEHYTTARDMARLSIALIHEFPEYYKIYSQKKFTYNEITQHNRNKLLWRDKSVDGMKTGHTDAAGYCLVASAKRDDMRLVSVVMGTDSEDARASTSQALLNYGFRFFETHKLYAANEALATPRVWKGATESLPLGLGEDLYVTIPRNRYDQLQASLNIPKTIVAPISKGSQQGTVDIHLEGDLVATAPLLTLEEISEGTLWQRLKDEALMLLEQ